MEFDTFRIQSADLNIEIINSRKLACLVGNQTNTLEDIPLVFPVYHVRGEIDPESVITGPGAVCGDHYVPPRGQSDGCRVRVVRGNHRVGVALACSAEVRDCRSSY